MVEVISKISEVAPSHDGSPLPQTRAAGRSSHPSTIVW